MKDESKTKGQLIRELGELRQQVAYLREVESKSDNAEKALIESKFGQRAILNNISDIAWLKDLEGKFVAVNEAFAKSCGWKNEKIPGKTDLDIWPLERALKYRSDDLEVINSGERKTLEEILVCQNGERTWIETIKTPVYNDAGAIIGTTGIARDITERKMAEAALRKSEEKYRDIFERAVEGIFQSTPEGKFISVNPSYASMLGYESPQELVTSVMNIQEQLYVDPKRRLRFASAFEESGTVMGFENQLFRKDGGKIWVSIKGRSVRDSDGKILYYEGMVENITERKLVEEALRQSEGYFRTLIENASDIILIVDQEGTIVYASPSVERFVGYKPEELVGKSGFELIIPEDLQRASDEFRQAILTRGTNIPNAFRVRHKDGSERILEGIGKNLLDNKAIAGFVMNVHDVTERRQADEELQKLASVVRHSKELVNLATLDGKMTFLNEAGMNMLGITSGEVTQTHILQVIPDHLQDMVRTELLPTLLRQGDWEGELQYLNLKSGKVTDVHAMTFTINEPATGVPLYLANVSLDISERKKAEKKLEESEERYRTVADFTYDWEQWIAPDGKFLYVSPSCRRVTGYQAQDFIDNPGLFLKMIHPEDYQAVKTHFHDQPDNSDVEHFEFRILRKDGEERWISHSCHPVYNSEGQWLGHRASNRDITDKKRLEGQLRQVQKMEAIGTLAGGIAHDFNNILTPILLGAELVQSVIPEENPAQKDLEKVIQAAERAKELVQQILTFSRQGEEERRPLEIIPVVKEVIKLIRASLPSTIEIKLRIEAIADIVTAAPIEIHQIIMNLCTNASHAMREKGGLLEIALINEAIKASDLMGADDLTRPGSYVKLTVRDTGHGMDDRTRERIFDPFFTNKNRGEGTGLGLSVVHGIIESLGGTITVESEIQEGTTFNVYLPCTPRKAIEEPEKQESSPMGSERILFIDDERAIANIYKKILERLGYKVTASDNVVEALNDFREDPGRFDLVVTDLTMPKMTGLELAKEILRLRPDLPIILCTGFSQETAAEEARQIGIQEILFKPIDRLTLAKTIRKLLDRT